ncbi:MAG: phosphoribosylamine--glycine ligase [Solobacterium sp.]|nr:phosphoribosylamine--glycine ligase [Solobacterium sp.]
MKVLVVGSGGREHAIIRKLKESDCELYCAPGNGGIAADAICLPVSATDVAGMVELAKQEQMDYVCVTPDDPLALGMVDALKEAGIPSFGPTKAAAQIEASKVFSKNLMKKYGIPTAAYEVFNDAEEARAYLKKQNSYPAVIKADGLALGKGVIIAADEEEAMKAIDHLMIDKAFGESGSRVVIEEFLTGVEVSVLAFADGTTVVPMVSSMDHKRANDNDEGLNTGGMGTIAPSPFYTAEAAARCEEEIFKPTMAAMKQEGCPFSGCLYFGLILTEQGPKVIEYNSRFGDPETQSVLPLLDSDLLTIMKACTEGTLKEDLVKWKDGAAACVIEASGGYPGSYEKGKEIHGLDETGQCEGVTVYHAGTKADQGVYYTSGGRVLGITGIAPTLKEALDKAYEGVSRITFEDMHYRHDIGAKALKGN